MKFNLNLLNRIIRIQILNLLALIKKIMINMTNKLIERRRERKRLKKIVDNMNEIILFGEDLAENPHETIKEALDFPDYYGENLDALFDCLTELYNKTIIIKDSSLVDKDIIDTFIDANEENPDMDLILD